MAPLEDWLILSLTPGLGAIGCKNLLNHFGSPAAVLKASPQAVLKAPGRLSKKACAAIGRQDIRDAASQELEKPPKPGFPCCVGTMMSSQNGC